MNFSSKKRPRKNAWRDLQKELDERERLEEENSAKLKKVDALKSRVCIEEEPNPEAKHAWIDIQIGRQMGKNPTLIKGRLIVELFDDLLPRTVEKFVDLLSREQEPTYRNSVVSKVFPGFHCVLGDRDMRIEGSSTAKENIYTRADSEANWQLPHLNPGILSLADGRSAKFQITFRKAEELDGWHAVFGKVIYGFDLLKLMSEQGETNGELKQPIVIVDGGSVPAGTHPRELLKKLELPDDPEAHGYDKKVMRYSSTYRHTGLIGH